MYIYNEQKEKIIWYDDSLVKIFNKYLAVNSKRQNTGVETGESREYLSLEELDAICAIAHELLEKER